MRAGQRKRALETQLQETNLLDQSMQTGTRRRARRGNTIGRIVVREVEDRSPTGLVGVDLFNILKRKLQRHELLPVRRICVHNRGPLAHPHLERIGSDAESPTPTESPTGTTTATIAPV
jgi:hypothetical protein